MFIWRLNLLLFSLLFVTVNGDLRSNDFMKKYDKVKVNERNFEKVHNMHINWYIMSIKALMSQLGKDLHESLTLEEKKKFEKCLLRIEDKKDLVKSAKCLTTARKKFLIRSSSSEVLNSFKKVQFNHRPPKVLNSTKLILFTDFLDRPRFTKATVLNFSNIRRHRRRRRSAGFFGRIPWKTNEGPGIKIRKVSHFKSIGHKSDKTPISRVVGLISQFVKNETAEEAQKKEEWSDVHRNLLSLKKNLEEKEKSSGSRAYNLRMYDLVLGNDKPTMTFSESKTPEGIIQQAMELFANLNNDDREKGNVKVLSPRLAPLMPDKAGGKGSFLSPTLFSLYEDDNNTANVASIPKMLKMGGVKQEERDQIVSLLMEMSGTTGALNEAMGLIKELNFMGMSDEVMDTTKKMTNTYENLEGTFNLKQKEQLKDKGFAFLNKDQLNAVYRDQGTSFPEEALGALDDYDDLDPKHRTEALWKTIERIAREEPLDKFKTRLRRRRDLTTPSVLAPVVLAPYMFAPVYGLSVLGPVVLSPSLFSPLILNPSVLGPFVLSPGVGMPFILSPYLLSPYVLSPLVMAPFILTPYVLSPNIINPYVLSPLILSPLVLCPDVLSPMVLGGNILSPSVASPAVLTESFLMASVLSPSFLS